MLKKINEDRILFLDIETVPEIPKYKDLSEKMKLFWDKKAKNISQGNDNSEEIYQRAGIYAEFGKIICISVGILFTENKEKFLRIKSFSGHDEKKILLDFRELLKKSFNSSDKFLCAHNGKEFDFPYIARRMLINSISLPEILDFAGKKPWEIRHIDTLELWKFGDYKHYTSLDLLAHIFDIPSSKNDIDGSQVARVYWEDNDLSRIVKYCESDVVTLVRLYLRYTEKNLIENQNIIYVS
jgi:predicted PolB exonuclease-like 3'-5' exonuclease